MRVERVRERAYRILIVEDDSSSANALAALLAEEGYEPLAVAAGAEAMARLADGRYDLLLLEPSLRDQTGPAVLRCAQQLKTPTIIITTDPACESSGMRDASIRGFLYKPFRVPELLDLLTTTLRR